MSVEEIALEGGHHGLALSDDRVRVVVLPDKGCDIYGVEPLGSGVDVLFKSPWGLLPTAPAARSPDSASHWLRHYPGGWQVILPNGGAEATAAGTSWGFHGEACLVPWACTPRDGGIDAETRLFYSPLRVNRELRLHDGRLRLREWVTNESPEPIELMWGHHPAFGAPFLEAGCRIFVGARTYVADDEQPGPGIEPGSRHQWPTIKTTDGGDLDLSVVGSDPVAYLGYLTDFDDHWFAITNPGLDLGVALRWSPGVLNHAWFWQELNASPGFPWFKRAYVTAIEPNSTFPAQGVETSPAKGGSLVRLEGGATADLELELIVFRGDVEVERVTEAGEVVPR